MHGTGEQGSQVLAVPPQGAQALSLTVRDGGGGRLQGLWAAARHRPHRVAPVAVGAYDGLAAPLPLDTFQLLQNKDPTVNTKASERGKEEGWLSKEPRFSHGRSKTRRGEAGTTPYGLVTCKAFDVVLGVLAGI